MRCFAAGVLPQPWAGAIGLILSCAFTGAGWKRMIIAMGNPNFWLKPATAAASIGLGVMSIQMIILGLARLWNSRDDTGM